MKRNPLNKTLAAVTAILLMHSPFARAATYTWDGGGSGSLWSEGLNWIGGVAVSGTGHSLVFAGTTKLSSTNTTITNVAGIEFANDAGAFVLNGPAAFTLAGNITNGSSSLQTINSGIVLNSTRTFDTGAGGIHVAGIISQNNASARTLIKYGTGTLTLTGANTYTGPTSIGAGRLLLDFSEGGSMASSSYNFGVSGGVPLQHNQGGILEVRGASESPMSLGGIGFATGAGGSQIIVGSNTVLNLTGLGAATGVSTLNINLSSLGSVLNSPATLTYNILPYATVTDATKTGFATVISGSVVRYTPTLLLPSSSTGVVGGTSNYYTSGNFAIGDVSANSLTITGSGSLTSGTLKTSAILMEEGVGNYTLKNAKTGLQNGSKFLIHQYSTIGTLTMESDLYGSSGNATNNSLAKTGPGAFIFKGKGEYFAGKTDIQGGLFQLDGSLEATNQVDVRSGATLSGAGTIGGGVRWTYSGGNVNSGTRYTPVNVFSGGTLDGTHHSANALKINGSLVLYAGSNFKVDLYNSAFAPVNIIKDPLGDGQVVSLDGNLVLTLNYAPVVGNTITLLTTDGIRSGTFSTINGVAFDGNFFALSYLSQSYRFEIVYGLNSVELLSVIPEPGTVGMFAVGTGLAAMAIRRRRNRR